MDNKSEEKTCSAANTSECSDGKEISEDLFLYFADYYRQLKNEIYQGMSERRQIVLTIMSFCLVAEMTFLGTTANGFSEVSKWAVTIALITWFAAFVLALFKTQKINSFFCGLGTNEDMGFLTRSEDVDDYISDCKKPPKSSLKEALNKADRNANYARRGHPTEYFIRKALANINVDLNEEEATNNTNDLRLLYMGKVKDLPTCPDFNRNAWLGKHSRALGRARVRMRSSKKTFMTVNILFLVNILAFLIGVITHLFRF